MSTRSLHPAAVLMEAVARLGQILVYVAFVSIVTLVGDGGSWPAIPFFAIGGVAVGAGAAWVSWHATTYWVEPRAIHFATGVFDTSKTTIPADRIQAVDETEGPIHRLFGVVELRVQTAGGGAGGEIVLRAVDVEEAARIRAVLGQPDPVAPDDVERLPLRGLLVAAATAPQFGVILPVLGALGVLGTELLSEDEDDQEAARQTFEQALDLVDTAGEIAVAVALFAAVAWVVSFVGAIVAFAGFTVEREHDRLRIRRGLLQRRAASIALARIDAVAVVEGVLRRPFGLAALRVETVGWAGEAGSAQTLMPVLRRRDALALAGRLVPQLAGREPPLRRPPAAAARSYAARPLLIAAGAGGAATWIAPEAWPAIPCLMLPAALLGLATWRAAGWAQEPHRILVREQRLARRTLVLRSSRVQQRALAQSPLQARAGLASLRLVLASDTARVRSIAEPDARAMFESL